DVELDVAVAALVVQVQQLRHDHVGDVVVDGRSQEDDAFRQQPAEDVVGTLPLRGALHDRRDLVTAAHREPPRPVLNPGACRPRRGPTPPSSPTPVTTSSTNP